MSGWGLECSVGLLAWLVHRLLINALDRGFELPGFKFWWFRDFELVVFGVSRGLGFCRWGLGGGGGERRGRSLYNPSKKRTGLHRP